MKLINILSIDLILLSTAKLHMELSLIEKKTSFMKLLNNQGSSIDP